VEEWEERESKEGKEQGKQNKTHTHTHKYRAKEINRERQFTNPQWAKQAIERQREDNNYKKIPKFKYNKVSVLVILMLVLQSPVLVLVSEKKFCCCLIKGEKKPKKFKNKNKKNPKFKGNTLSVSPIHFQLVLQHPILVLSLSHQRKRKTKQNIKESRPSFVNVYLRLGFTCHLPSTIYCCRLYLCRSQE
jgi:hypothetical protein